MEKRAKSKTHSKKGSTPKTPLRVSKKRANLNDSKLNSSSKVKLAKPTRSNRVIISDRDGLTTAKENGRGTRIISQNGKKPGPSTKKSEPLPKAKSPIQPSETTSRIEPEPPFPKTRLTAKQLREFRNLLLAKRSEMVRDVLNLTDEALYRQRDGFHSEHSAMPIHMADVGSDNWEQELTLGLVENERSRLREIDEALDRIEDKTYGVCLATHKPISLARLRAQPWTKFCIDYARQRDEGRLP